MKNKSLFLSLLTAVMFMFSVSAFAITYSTSTYTAFIEFPLFKEASFNSPNEGSVPKNISAVDKELKIETNINFGGYNAVKNAQLIYYFDDMVTSTNTVTYTGPAYNKTSFYMETAWNDTSYTNINFQIRVNFEEPTDKMNADQAAGYICWPSSTSATPFHRIPISASAQQDISASTGGTVEYDNGNQEIGNVVIEFPEDSLSGDTTIIITELTFAQATASNFVSAVVADRAPSSAVNNNRLIKAYTIASSNPSVTTINPPAKATLPYGSETTATKFELKYRADENSAWEDVQISSVDTSARTVTAYISKFGQYAIFVSSNLGDNEYRPKKRARVKSRIANGTYAGFEFNNLVEGDSVKIYNLNGKKVAELTAGDSNGFVWKGKKGTNNSGEWAESGTYVYQIKVKDKGKIISGTIAFVW